MRLSASPLRRLPFHSLTLRRSFADSLHFPSHTAKFSDLGISQPICDALAKLKFRTPTRIQEQAIPCVLQGSDLVIAAETGCGKTLSYVVPIMELFLSGKVATGQKWPPVVVLCPSRELCNQILNVFIQLCAALGSVSVLPRVVFGLEKFPAPFHKVTDVLITTPTAFQTNESRELYTGCHYLILDEADWLLADAVSLSTKHIVETFLTAYEKKNNPQHPMRFIFVGATIPITAEKSVGMYLQKHFPRMEWLSGTFLHRHKPNIKQTWIEVPCENWELAKLGAWRLTDGEKSGVKEAPKALPDGILTPVAEKRLGLLLENLGDPNKRTIVFCLNLASCQQVSKYLTNHKRPHVVIHGRTDQKLREQALEKFATGEVNIFVCTNVATRGLDFAADHVIQYDFAENVVEHIHRIGRTGRLSPDGVVRDAQVTNFFTTTNRHLVNAIQAAGDEPLDKTFSRNRLFRHKLRKALKAKTEVETEAVADSEEGEAPEPEGDADSFQAEDEAKNKPNELSLKEQRVARRHARRTSDN